MNIHPFHLLIGAGFSKNFGGCLASEMWAAIYNQREIQRAPALRLRMLQNPSYEDLFHELVVKRPATDPERQIFQKAVTNAMNVLDETLSRLSFQHRIDYGAMNKQMITRFCGKDDMHPGFIFSLNQDLYFERHYKESPEPNLPGLRRHVFGQSHFKDAFSVPLRTPEDMIALPTAKDLQEHPIHHSMGNFALIKLQGAMNFKSALDPERLVIGHGSGAEVSNEPLLQAYFDLFQNAMAAGGTRLLVIGYSFQLPHINAVLLENMRAGKLEVFVVNPVDPWWSRQVYQAGVFEGLSAYFPYDLFDLFLRNRSGDTVAWKEVKKQFFETA